jgi:lysophospholipase
MTIKAMYQTGLANMVSYLNHMNTADGCAIRYGIWRSRKRPPRGSVLVLSGRTEFLEKYADVIAELNGRGWDVYSFDWRGQGLSSRMLKNPHKGHVVSYNQYLEDLDQFVRDILRPEVSGILICLAHSMGAHIAMRYLHDFPGAFDRAVFTSAMIDIQTIPFPMWFARKLTFMAMRRGQSHCYAPGQFNYRPGNRIRFHLNLLTQDFSGYMAPHLLIKQTPGLALGGVTCGWLNAAFESIDIMKSKGYAERIGTPVLMVCAGADRVVSVQAQRDICARMPNCAFEYIEGSYHEILKENKSILTRFWNAFDGFITDKASLFL